MRKIAAAAMLLTLSTLVTAAEVHPPRRAKFAQPPTATKPNGKVVVTFAVSARTDVEVAILDARGKVVRHLAAGVLGGEKAPPAPLRKGLAQSLSWDLRDDFGKPASGGPFKVRVRIGTSVEFGRQISGSPYVFNNVKGLATDKDGNLYVLNQNFGYGSNYIQVFDAEGKYLKTIMPFSTDLPADSVSSFSHRDGERPVMKNFMDVYPCCMPFGTWRKGNLQLISSSVEAGVIMATSTTVLRLKKDGGTWGKGVAYCRTLGRDRQWNGKKKLTRDQRAGGVFSVAASPDGKKVYASALHSKSGKDGKPVNPHWPEGCIYAMDLKPGAELEPWVTLKGGAITVKAVDAKGNVYAKQGGKIVVVSSAGKRLGDFECAGAARVVLHPKTNEIYVVDAKKVSRRKTDYKLVKYSAWPKPGKRHETPIGGPFAVVTASKDKTVVWAASGCGRVGRGNAVRYEERGGKLVETLALREKDPRALGNHDCIAVDPRTEEVYINDDYSKIYRFSGLTGEMVPYKGKKERYLHGTDLAVGPDGYLYVRSGPRYSGPFERRDRNLKPVPFGGSGSHVLSPYIYSRYGAGYGEKGIGVARDGKCYLSFMYGWTKYCTAGFGPDGKALKGKFLEGKVGKSSKAGSYPKELTSAIIGPIPKTNGGVRVDSRGNIYLGVGQLPKGYKRPAMYAKDRAHAAMVGSVIKFGPEGGGWIKTKPKSQAIKEPAGKIPDGVKAVAFEAGHFVVGAKQVFTGIAPYSGTYGTGRASLGKGWCDCRSARFDLDMYDRLYLPNCIDNSVRVYDNAGNIVIEFGGYANFDSQYVPKGKKTPAVVTKHIPLGWPIGTGVSEKHIYVCDQLNRCVVRVDVKHAAEAVCTVGGGAASITRPSARTAAHKSSDDSDTSDLSDRSDKSERIEISKAAKPAPARSRRSPAQVCTGWFSAARNYRRIGMKQDARRCLNNIVKSYPDTEWAAKAKTELAEL
jgi:DNA-binding beta-propeller fold protein YncE